MISYLSLPFQLGALLPGKEMGESKSERAGPCSALRFMWHKECLRLMILEQELQ